MLLLLLRHNGEEHFFLGRSISFLMTPVHESICSKTSLCTFQRIEEVSLLQKSEFTCVFRENLPSPKTILDRRYLPDWQIAGLD